MVICKYNLALYDIYRYNKDVKSKVKAVQYILFIKVTSTNKKCLNCMRNI